MIDKNFMITTTLWQVISLLWILLQIGVSIYVVILVIKALRKYIKSEPVRKVTILIKKSLGEVLKKHRLECSMTQEFVAESIGVSRQAVSKWESGASDSSTVNLLALAKLFDVETEELLRETKPVQQGTS